MGIFYILGGVSFMSLLIHFVAERINRKGLSEFSGGVALLAALPILLFLGMTIQ